MYIENMDPEETIALTIWWCEGTKPRRDKRWKNAYLYPVEVINSDPKIVNIFVNFLRNRLEVPLEKIHGQIQIHEGDDKDAIENFWSKSTGIAKTYFNKTIIRKKGNKPGKNKGTFKVRLYDKTVYEKLKSLLDSKLKLINSGV